MKLRSVLSLICWNFHHSADQDLMTSVSRDLKSIGVALIAEMSALYFGVIYRDEIVTIYSYIKLQKCYYIYIIIINSNGCHKK